MHLSYVSLISDEYESLADFYTTALGLREHLSWRHDGFRALDAGGDTSLAFHSPAAAAELRLPVGVRMMPTFDPGSVVELEAAAERLADGGNNASR